MKKKIIITILGLLVLMAIQFSINLFVLNKSMTGVAIAPLWAAVYSGYIYLMITRYIGL